MSDNLGDIIYDHVKRNEFSEAKSRLSDASEKIGRKDTIKALAEVLHRYSPHSWFRRNIVLLRIFEREHLAGIGTDILSKMTQMDMPESPSSVKKYVSGVLYSCAEKEIQEGCSTLFYDLEGFDDAHIELSQNGLRMRNARFANATERLMGSCCDSKDSPRIDLIEVWSTHIGFEILTNLGVDRYVERSKIEDIKTAVSARLKEIESEEVRIPESGLDYIAQGKKIELLDRIIPVLGSRIITLEVDPTRFPPSTGNLKDAIDALHLMGGPIAESALLDILGAVWLFPKNSTTTWNQRKRILDYFSHRLSSTDVKKIISFLNTLTCRTSVSNSIAADCISSAVYSCIEIDKEPVYPTLVRMLTCLSSNQDSVLAHVALEVLHKHCIDRVIHDLPRDSILTSWLKKNRKILHIEPLQQLVLEAYRQEMERDPEQFRRWTMVFRHFEKAELWDALAEIMNCMTIVKPEEIGFLSDYGTTLAHAGKYEAASRVFEKLLEQHPDNPSYLNNLAFTSYLSGAYDKALELSERAVKHPDADHHAWHTHGATLHALDRHEKAEKAYRKSIEVNREHFDAWEDLIRLLNDMGRHEEAEAAKSTYQNIRFHSFSSRMDETL